MALKATAQITLSSVIDVKATYRYYRLQSSTLTKPAKPTTFPPASTWGDVEPNYVDGSTNSLYFVDCTVFCDDTFNYSEVSLSSAYEAAKTAYNKATNAQNAASNAQNTANNAQSDIDNLEIGTRNLALNSDEEVSNNDYMFKAYSLSTPLVPGEIYTATMCVTPAPGVSYYGLYLSSGYRPTGRFTVSGTEEQTISLTFTAGYADGKTPEDDLSNAQNQIYRFPNDNTVTENSTIRWYKVEKGNRATDWTPAPEDTELKLGDANKLISDAQTSADNAQNTANAAQSKADSNALQIEYLNTVVQKVQDSLKTFVIDENGTTLLDQTGTSWKFNFSDLSGSLDNLNENMVSALEHRGYISFEKNDGDPYIIIAASETGLKLKLTASSIEFLDASNNPLVDILSSDEDGDVGLTTDKINVVEELVHPNPKTTETFVWKVRNNGNFGLSWKG